MYVVEQVNGSPLPARLNEYPGGHTELVSGGLDLRLDGSFVETGAVRLVSGPVTNTNTHTATGRYLVDGARLVMTYSQAVRSVTGTAEGARLTVQTESMTIASRAADLDPRDAASYRDKHCHALLRLPGLTASPSLFCGHHETHLPDFPAGAGSGSS
jgi:hypothetical protein